MIFSHVPKRPLEQPKAGKREDLAAFYHVVLAILPVQPSKTQERKKGKKARNHEVASRRVAFVAPPLCVCFAPQNSHFKNMALSYPKPCSPTISLSTKSPLPPPPRSSIYKIPSSDPHDPRLGLGLGRRRRSGIGRGRGAVVVAVVGPVVVEAVEEADEEVGDVGVREVAGVGGNGCWFVCVND